MSHRATIAVSFRPLEARPYSGTLLVRYEKTNSEVSLSGVGIYTAMYAPPPAGTYWRHRVRQGDTLHNIAWFYYNDADRIEPILRSNPRLPFRDDLDDFIGETILVPIEVVVADGTAVSVKEPDSGIKRLLQMRGIS